LSTRYKSTQEQGALPQSVTQRQIFDAIEALDTLLKKRREEADKEFKKATTAARIDINEKKNALRRKGV
jgi:hypothetical protein